MVGKERLEKWTRRLRGLKGENGADNRRDEKTASLIDKSSDLCRCF